MISRTHHWAKARVEGVPPSIRGLEARDTMPSTLDAADRSTAAAESEKYSAA